MARAARRARFVGLLLPLAVAGAPSSWAEEAPGSRGAIAGRVELEGGGGGGGCMVRLAHELFPVEAQVRHDGSFRLVSVPAGRWVVVAELPGWLPSTSRPISVLPGETTELTEPLVLRRAADLELLFSPPTGEAERGWSVVLTEISSEEGAVTTRSGRGDANGVWSATGLAPGDYRLAVADEAGRELYSESVAVPAGRSSIQIELPIVHLSGWVGVGEEGLAAQLTFSQSRGSLRATFESGADGLFSGVLPGEGSWLVWIRGEGVDVRLEEVEVWAYATGGFAEVEIVVPGTDLEGEVTDALGNAVEDAVVVVRAVGSPERSRRAVTDASGRFRLRALPPGTIWVTATAGPRRSPRLQMVIDETRRRSPLRLVVR